MQALGVAISLLGVAVILTRGDVTVLASLQLNRGDLWVLLATLSWAIYTVCLRWRPRELNPLAMLWTIAAIGVVRDGAVLRVGDLRRPHAKSTPDGDGRHRVHGRALRPSLRTCSGTARCSRSGPIAPGLSCT